MLSTVTQLQEQTFFPLKWYCTDYQYSAMVVYLCIIAFAIDFFFNKFVMSVMLYGNLDSII